MDERKRKRGSLFLGKTHHYFVSFHDAKEKIFGNATIIVEGRISHAQLQKELCRVTMWDTPPIILFFRELTKEECDAWLAS